MKLSQLRKIVREELEKYDGGFTDEWNDQRKKNAEVLGYKLSGKSDIKEAVKDPKLKVGQKIRHKNDPRKVYTLKKITHGNRGIPEDPAGTSYMFVASGNRKEYHTKKTWAQAIKKGWIIKESINESGMGILDKDQTDVLHAIVMRNKNKNSNSILKIALKDRMFKGIDKRELLGYIEGAKQFVRYMGRTGNESVNETQKRDYKAEYKKFQSSTKAKKYRAELNQYNRKKGTYGNGDGKDASHKGGKIAGFEKESTNRGRAEKSRLKKEDDMPDFEPMIDKILDEVIEEYQMNEDLTPLRKIYSDLDKKFPKYNHKKISDFNKAYKFLKRKLKPGSQLPDFVASFYNDYKGGEDITKNHKRFFKYTKKMLKKGESVNEANIIQKIDKLAKSNKYGTVDGTRMNGKTAKEIMAIFMHPKMNSYRRQMTGMKAHELVDLTISLLKPLKIKVESVDTVFKETLRKFIRQELVKEDWWSEMSPPAQDQYVKDHPDSEKAKSVKKSKEKGEKEKRELAKKIKSGEYELDSATGKAVKKKKGKEDPKKRNKHVAAIRKGYFPGTPEYEKFMKEAVNEKISKEEWAEYPKYARKLKPYMQKLLKVPLKVRVIKQANHNPWIEIRVAKFGKDIIPNSFRKLALKVVGGSGVRDMDNINYGNIRSNSISLKHDQWVKLLGNKV